ncbi:MAG: ribose transport system substrate-binding protein [Clostridiales bacterium]|jgi:ribose transport system substrate-binding protein|nr:ribose transport system substrate-binding protein [Clostridiales bacterium]
MMKKKLIITILALAMVLGMAACGGNETTTTTAAPTESTTENPDGTEATDETTAGAEDVSIILVTMDGLDNHWVNVDKGAQAAAEELGIKYQWMAPDKKDTALQIEMLNNAIAAQCDGLVVAAVDPDAVVATLQSAEDAGIKVVYADSTSKFEAVAQYTTDNYAAAVKAGEQMIAGLTEKGITSGDIGIVAFSNATQTSIDREQGFRDAFEGTDFNLLETQYGNSEVAASQAAAENFISQGVVGVYGNNEPGAVGVGNAVAANSGWEGIAVGFDASDTTLDLVDNGALYCVMAQNPYQMGYGAVNAAYKAAIGEELAETKVDTGADVVTPENSDDFRA